MHAAPMYIAETASSQIRGQLISLKEFFMVLGMLVGYTVGSLSVETVAGWRYMYGVSSPLSLIMGIVMWWLPESPRWILLRAIQGKGNVQSLREKSITCLCLLRSQNISDSAPKQVKCVVPMDLPKGLYKAKSEFKYAMKSYCMEYYFKTTNDGKVADWSQTLHDLQLSFGDCYTKCKQCGS